MHISWDSENKVMLSPLTFTAHARTIMHEQLVHEDWIISAVKSPDQTEDRPFDERHYLKMIPSAGRKILRVVVNPSVSPARVITVFFDRRVQP